MFRRIVNNEVAPECVMNRAIPNTASSFEIKEEEMDKIQEAKLSMMKIQEIELKTKKLLSNKFKTALSNITQTCNMLSAGVFENSENAVENMQKYMDLVQEHKIIEYVCQSCELILKEAQADSYPGMSEALINTFDKILRYLVDLSDQFAQASETISRQTGLVKEINAKLLHWHKTFSHDELERDIQWIEDLISLLHNVSMYDENVTRMKSANTIGTVQPYLDFKNNTIRLLSLATMADLIDESESKMIRSESDVIEFLMTSISNALDECGTYDGWSLVELTRIVHQVARNDNNKRMIANHGVIPLLVKICESSSVKQQAEAVRAIWRLAFDHENKKEMLTKTEWNVVSVLTKLSESPDANVKSISNKALWTINDTEQKRKEGKPKKLDTDQHVMISYNWGHQSMAKQIRDRLISHGMKVWMDLDNMTGSTIQAMASAVEQAFIILMCFSYKYKNSDNCRAEAEYAFQLKKKIIPVKMEMGYKADGWLGFIIGAKLFFDFSGKYPFENKMTELYKELTSQNEEPSDEIKIQPELETSSVVHSSPPVKHHSDKIGKIRKWSDSSVDKWLSKHDLPKEKLGKLRGKDVAFLCMLLEESPDNFYRLIRKQFHIKDLENTANLRFAIYDLTHKHSK